MHRFVYLIASLLITLYITPNFAGEAPKKAARIKTQKQKQPKQIEKAEAPKETGHYYIKHEGGLKDLLGPYCLVKNRINRFDIYQKDYYFGIENVYGNPGEHPEEIKDRRFELVVAPRSVKVSSGRWDENHLWEHVETTLYTEFIKFEYIDLNEPEPKHGFSKVLKHYMELWIKVELSPSHGYTPTQKETILNSLKNNKPIHIKGLLKLHTFGTSPEEVKEYLERYGLTFVAEEIEGEPVKKSD